MDEPKSKKKGILVCGCKEANFNCYLTCSKCMRLKPGKVYNIPQWRKA